MARTISKIAVAALSLLALAVFTPQAKASGADFTCGGTACTGTVGVVGTVYSSSAGGIGVTAAPGFNLPGFGTDEAGQSFKVTFSADTSTGNGSITLTDSTDADATLSGTISNFTVTGAGTALAFDVLWTTPPGFVGSSHVGISLSANSNLCGTNAPNCVDSVDIPVAPTPEPASLLLLGTGLLGLGGVARRRWSN